MRGILYADAGGGGIGADEAVELAILEHMSQVANLGFAHIGGNLHHQRHVAAGFAGQIGLFALHEGEKVGGAVGLGQILQVGHIRAGEVDGHIVGYIPHSAKAGQVILVSFGVRGHLVLADVHAEHALEAAGAADVLHAFIHAGVVDAHVVDDSLLGNAAEQAGLGVARLRAGGEGAYLHKAETEVPESSHGVGFLIHAGGQTHAVRELETHHGDGVFLRFAHHGRQQGLGGAQTCQSDFVCCFRVHAEQHLLGQIV